MRKKAEAEASAELSSEETAATGSSQAWAMLIKRIYEVDPLSCPECGGQMKVVAFIEPPQTDVIEEILQHCGLWHSSSPRAPPDVEGLVLELDAAYSASSIDSLDQADASQELTYVDSFPLELAVSPTRISSGTGNQISYQWSATWPLTSFSTFRASCPIRRWTCSRVWRSSSC